MNGPQARESRPAGYQAAPHEDIHRDEDDTPSVEPGADTVLRLSRVDIYDRLDREPMFASVVRRPDGALTRRVHAGIGPARRAVQRARERGYAAELVLVELTVLAVVGGEDR